MRRLSGYPIVIGSWNPEGPLAHSLTKLALTIHLLYFRNGILEVNRWFLFLKNMKFTRGDRLRYKAINPGAKA